MITEAAVAPTLGEFIEIHNPTGSSITLTNIYLSDDSDYPLLPGFSGAGPAPSIGAFDFIARFPAGATIAADGIVVVAFSGTGFETTYGFKADYELLADDAGTADMLEAYSGSIGGSAGLTNAGENAVIFQWDGASDLVQDHDMVIIGTPSAANTIANKTGDTNRSI